MVDGWDWHATVAQPPTSNKPTGIIWQRPVGLFAARVWKRVQLRSHLGQTGVSGGVVRQLQLVRVKVLPYCRE